MNCTNCGTEIKDMSQKFCKKCGTPINNFMKTGSSSTTQIIQQSLKKAPIYDRSSYISRGKSNYIENNKKDSHSKIGLIFGLASFFLVVVPFFNMYIAFINPYQNIISIDFYYKNALFFAFIILIIIFYINGLIFGILGKVQANQAKDKSGVNKASNILSILGIILSSILLAFTIFAFLSMIQSSMSYYYIKI